MTEAVKPVQKTNKPIVHVEAVSTLTENSCEMMGMAGVSMADMLSSVSVLSLGINLGMYCSYAMTVVEMTDTRMPIVFFVALGLQVDASSATSKWSRVQARRTNSMGHLDYLRAAGLR